MQQNTPKYPYTPPVAIVSLVHCFVSPRLADPTRPQQSKASSMELMEEELIEEVLICVPPDEPAYLVRAALVCKPWRRVLSDHGFLRRYRVFHRMTPPLLGYLHNLYSRGPIPRFVPTTTTTSPFAAAPPPPLGGCERWRALDCRQGRVLARALFDPDDDPLVRCLAMLTTYPRTERRFTGAVLCAAVDGWDHLGCHGGPFMVVYMVADEHHAVRVSVYSFETDAWGPPSAAVHVDRLFDGRSSLLAGGALHFALYGGEGILKLMELKGMT
ncbi:hypothetical protein HU200_022767 [Digitaria exilis]|uniref:F-box domain-containing protein n=1 Tax=Digitaria exilis TaxID=1010633 RepID=A0A835EYH4_9POAL|nr:hypothetical protein HU200_022767 [Digitaria exilis]CAB3493982.1 unnamed protein product [Digitaria exilis]